MGPIVRAEGALHVTLAWAGEMKQEDRAGVSVALPKVPWTCRGEDGSQRLRGGWGGISHLHTSRSFPHRLCESPAPTGNAQHHYLQNKTELTNITNN